MTDLSDFPVTRLFPPAHPDRLQLYSRATPNGVKVSIMLEEIGLPYEAHKVSFGEDGTGSAAFKAIQPVGKIPAILDPNGPGGAPLAVFESGAILLYLADKTGKLIGPAPARRQEAIQWVFWQNAGLGVMIGQFAYFFSGDGKDIADKRPLERFASEARRFLWVLEKQLEGRGWVAGDYSIADVTMIGWVGNAFQRYGEEAVAVLELDRMPNLRGWLDRAMARPAVQRGLTVPA